MYEGKERWREITRIKRKRMRVKEEEKTQEGDWENRENARN